MLYLKFHTNIKIQLVFIVVKESIANDHSAQLVRIADAFGDLPFCLLHRRSAFAFGIFTFWIIGRYRFITLELWVRLRPFGESLNALGDPQAFFSSSFQLFCSFLPISSCDTPLLKNLKLTILSSNANSSSTKIKIQLVFIVVKKYVAKDHSVQLVDIVDALGDPPFGMLHCLSTFAFSIFAFWIIRLSTLELWARLRPFGELPNELGDPQVFFSSSFQPFCSFLPSCVHALPQTPNT
ncbi:hypothetical protein H5410_031209 [Solanum commersonii]|uniref:Uncharacterized protein n=1 Tax=Solanum commersonii TaxID=4109 RepID=A0A9J5YJ90_SOLCO|nr:hypothetical protein H5410_031209 [Solanum commersonii]